MLRLSIFTACLIATALMSLPSQAQSFNCNRASRPDEVLICQRPDLSRLDEEMASLFDSLRNSLYGRARQELVQQQTWWLQSRMGCGYDYGCVRGA